MALGGMGGGGVRWDETGGPKGLSAWQMKQTGGTRAALPASKLPMRILFLLTLLVSACAAQVKLTIAVPDGRTSFYLDETIPVVLTFEGLIAKTHFVRMSAVNRPDQSPGLDEFTLDPAEGVEDPLAHWPGERPGHSGSFGS